MARPRKRRTPAIPRIEPIQRAGQRTAGGARDTYLLRQTRIQTPTGPRETGNGNGKGSYGPNRLHGQAQGKARASAKKTAWPRTQRALDDLTATAGQDTTRLLPFRPTHSIGQTQRPPRRPRTQAAGYDSRSKTIRILFSEGESSTSKNGAIYEYYGVPYSVWRMVKRNVSTGRTINRTLNNYAYAVLRPAP